MLPSLSSVPPVWPRPWPEIIGTKPPHAATIGARIRLTLSPMPPVECLSRTGPSRPASDQSRTVPNRVMARVSDAHSWRVIPRKNTAIAKAAIWASLAEPSTIPSTRSVISSSVRVAPFRLQRISSAGGFFMRPPEDCSRAGVREGVRAEAQGQKLTQRGGEPDALGTAQVDSGLRRRELGELLAAPPARRQQLWTLGQEHDLDDVPITRCDHGPDGGGLGAQREAVRGVLDVAACVELPARGPDASAHPEARVWRVRIRERTTSQVEHVRRHCSTWGAPTWPPTPPTARPRPGQAGARLGLASGYFIAPSYTARRSRAARPRARRSRPADTRSARTAPPG